MKPLPVRISPILPLGLAIIATGFCFFAWLIGEAILSPLFAATTPSMNESGLQIADGLRVEWIVIPIIITVLLWIWAALVVTRRQVTTRPAGPYYFYKLTANLLKFRSNQRGIVPVIVVGGVALVVIGLFWIVFTLPASATIEAFGGVSGFAADAQNTVLFMFLFIGAVPIISGLLVMAWGFTRTIEERETGFSGF